MKKRMLNCLVAAAVLALALTGCGGGQKSGMRLRLPGARREAAQVKQRIP